MITLVAGIKEKKSLINEVYIRDHGLVTMYGRHGLLEKRVGIGKGREKKEKLRGRTTRSLDRACVKKRY